ncbi:hypothetical protein [Acetobacter senegalensis]|uniref:hypothetical protein n=1 Tax=Acetobacter senegalensis TaxID=446692 RepID=UPI000AFB618A|nr:hypothetical protein [Acetobacter senegalensis]MCG4256932.1 hypothetical protein [Acetobacter senegalensis]MCG4266930.1 hypothetical protein [Acetobacter senegalensis]MCG4273889.1 hypothetical protein [Acetobacter senegalensis]
MTLRLRPDVYEVVRKSAFGNYRSMTAEINELLLEAINAKEKAPEPRLGNRSDASDSE